MLIQFSCRNFRSFKDSFTIDMYTEKEDTISSPIGSGTISVYPSAVFYGANGSGKSNVLKAFAMMRRLILNKDKIMQSTDNLPMDRFKLSEESSNGSSAFDVCFFYSGKRYKYGFEYDENVVYSEYLFVYESVRRTTVFEYDRAVGNGKIRITSYKDLKGISHLENSLFLVEADRAGNSEAKSVLDWFKSISVIDNSFAVFYSNYWAKMNDPSVKDLFISFIRDADTGISDFYTETQKIPFFDSDRPGEEKTIDRVTIKTVHAVFDKNNDKSSNIAFDLFREESFGTQKYFNIIGPIVNALMTGSVLFIDELDASLHPVLTRKIVSLFNGESNKKGAQLIFTSQDTNLLDQTLFDKEQIWFVEKDKYGASHLAALSEYRDVRKGQKIEKNYIMGKYGAIPYLGDYKY